MTVAQVSGEWTMGLSRCRYPSPEGIGMA